MTMQHDVYDNPALRMRRMQPFVAVLQADMAEGPLRLICPLLPAATLTPSRAAPLLVFQAQNFVLAISLMGAVPGNLLRRPVGSIAAYRDDIVRALDWLFTGI